MPKCLD